MRTIIFIVLIAVFTGRSTWAQKAPEDTVANAITPENGKDFLFQYYQKTLEELQKSLAGLTEAQLQFKLTPDSWSISQCLSHIVLTEKMIFEYAKKGMELPANPKRKSDVKITDEELIKGMTNRSQKVKAPENSVLNDQKYTVTQAINDLEHQRKEIFDYINLVSLDDLRNHVSDSPFGPVDAYHSLLSIPSHTSRHTLQIEEVKSAKNFPK